MHFLAPDKVNPTMANKVTDKLKEHFGKRMESTFQSTMHCELVESGKNKERR